MLLIRHLVTAIRKVTKKYCNNNNKNIALRAMYTLSQPAASHRLDEQLRSCQEE